MITEVICANEECGYMIWVDHSTDPDEVKLWGEYSAECIHCGARYRRLERQSDWSWMDEGGEILLPIGSEGKTNATR